MSFFDTVLHKLFGSPHERKVKSLHPVIEEIRKVRKALESLDDKELVAKSDEFRAKLAEGKTLEDIKVEAFAGETVSGVLTPGPLAWVMTTVALPLASVVP